MNLSRREFLRDAAIFTGVTAAAGVASAIDWPFLRTPKAEAGSGLDEDIKLKYDGQSTDMESTWPELPTNLGVLPRFAPLLPENADGKETEVKQRLAKDGDAWRTTFNRLFILPSDHPLDHYRVARDAAVDYAVFRGWGAETLHYPGVWGYMLETLADPATLKKHEPIKVKGNGAWVDIDPIRLNNDAVAFNVLRQGTGADSKKNMAIYTVPGTAILHARLAPDNLHSDYAVGFAVNRFHKDLLTGGRADMVPAVHFEVNRDAPVTFYYCTPTNGEGAYSVTKIVGRAETRRGHITAHLPTEGAIGSFSPFLVAHTEIEGANEDSETEHSMIASADFVEGAPEWRTKNRITLADVKARGVKIK